MAEIVMRNVETVDDKPIASLTVEADTAAYMPAGVPASVRTGPQGGVRILVTFPEGDLGKVGKVWTE